MNPPGMMHASHRWLPCLLLATGIVFGASIRVQADESSASSDYFERHIRPLLIDACLECHDEGDPAGGLRLDSRERMLAGGESGAAVVPGDPEASRLLQAVKRTGDLEMPPDRPLSPDQIEQLEAWISMGAPWPDAVLLKVDDPQPPHWAFQPLQKPAVPQPGVDASGRLDTDQSDAGRSRGEGSAWGRNPIDAFVLRKLQANGLQPSPQADRRTLIRRATYDLTGLAPTHAEIESFVNDDAEDAWPRLIDRLLESPHYGEKWGRHWLDVARYSDSKGYVYGREERFWVHAWAYRDWVVKALNDDMPYDRFLLLQIAADQVDGEPGDLAAMGFLTLGRRFLGVPHDIIDDRIDVLTRGTMALTVACARCHDHKYDPIAIEDYYSLYGVFRNCDERLVSLREIEDQESEFAKGLRERTAKLQEARTKYRNAAADRVRARIADYLVAQLHLSDYPEAGFDQIYVESDIIPEFVRHWREFLEYQAARGDTVFEAWRRFQAIDGDDFPAHAAKVCQDIQSAPASEIDSRIAALFAEPPSDMESVAARYGEFFQRTVEAINSEGPDEEGRSDDGKDVDDPVIRVLYGKASPCEVPDEPIVNIERFFPTDDTVELWKLRGEIDRWLLNSSEAPPQALILVDKETPAVNAHVMRRGDPRLLGERVPRRFLSSLSDPASPAFEHGSGRLELARAIVSPDNPLTARVAVNRIWMHHFGRGMVATPSDFGRRAEPPSHPELLDWLAGFLLENDWKLKPLHRLIMQSSTYQQRSLPAEPEEYQQAASLDPSNAWLWRYSPRRLAFEELRDAMLKASGELDTSIGGKPVDLLTSRRRTVYARIDRQFFSSLMRIFDVASPDLHIAKRAETTVPQQALFFLNHPFVIDRAKALAEQTQHLDEAERVRELYRSVFQRDPTTAELDVAIELVSQAAEPETPRRELPTQWSYGLGEYQAEQQRVVGFQPLPYFNGNAWQGGPSYPDPTLGWVQLTARGGHPGNVLAHASVRRWTAPRNMQVEIRSQLVHEPEVGDGIRAYLVSSKAGLLHQADVHHTTARFDVDNLTVEAGETIDFVVDILAGLNSDQYLWSAEIRQCNAETAEATNEWDSQRDFGGLPTSRLGPWEVLAQVLLSTNEFMFVD